MYKLMKGGPVAARITEETISRSDTLRRNGTIPTMAIIRMGRKESDLYYEREIIRKADRAGIKVEICEFGIRTDQEVIIDAVKGINENPEIHGVIVLLPLPDHIDTNAVCEAIAPEKDVDGVTDSSLAGVFTESDCGFPPCTAEAVIKIMEHYNVNPRGKTVTVFGRSPVVGKPVSQMLMGMQATVTVCHSRTPQDIAKHSARTSDIVIAAIGRANAIGRDMLGENQVVIDVGINTDNEGRLCGDVNFEEVADSTACITPVPGGVGSVTTAILMKHVVDAAEKAKGYLNIAGDRNSDENI